MNVATDRVRDIFLAALKVPSMQREAYLGEACGGDHELRNQVERLLQAHAELGSIAENSGEPLRPTVDQPGAERPGTIIGPYKLIEQIGEGGMGTVWMAQQQEPVKRLVALKLIKAGMDSRQVIARFEAERQALALMDHPNIAKVLDGGTSNPGRPYFVMELVKGIPITKYCDEHQLTPRQRLELFLPVCQAVQHAHQKGIIHRDLKPSNVLVALYDGKPVPKVIDFGVAKAVGQPLTEHTLVTGFGAIVGTLEYMSPEQAEINQLDIDTRSDIYSLGVLLYELLTGTTPLEHKRVKESGLIEALRIIREEEVPTLSNRLSSTADLSAIAANRGTEPAKLTRLVRGELDWIVMKALEKDRNRRYETANALALDVQRYLADEPVQACPPSAAYRLRKFASRHQGALLVVAVIALLLVAGVAGSTWQAVRATQAEGKARQAQGQAEANLRKARQAVDDYFTLMSDQILLDEPALEPFRKQLLQVALRYYQDFVQEHGNAPELQAELAAAYFRIAVLTYELGPGEDWVLPVQKCVDLMEAVLRRKPDAAAFDCFGTGICRMNGIRRFHSRNPPDEDRRIFSKAHDIWEELVRAYPTVPAFKNDLATIDLILGILLTNLPEEAVRYHRRACELWRNLTETYPKVPHYRAGLAVGLIVLGDSLGFLREWPQAEVSLRQGLAEAQRLAAEYPQTPRWRELHGAWGTSIYADLLHREGRLGEAVDVYRQAASAQESLLQDRPQVARYRTTLFLIRVQLGDALWEARRREEAAEAYRQALALAERLDPKDPDAQDQLAWFLATCPDHQFRDARRAVELAQQLLDLAPYPRDDWLITLGAAHYAAGDYVAAIRTLEKAIRLPRGPYDFYYQSAGFFLAMSYWQIGDKDQGRQWYGRTVAEMQKRPVFAESRLLHAEADKVLGLRGKED